MTRDGLSTAAEPTARSLQARFGWRAAGVTWGASAAVLCGALAAGADPGTSDAWLRLLAAWFAAVPLLGALWVPLCDRATGRDRVAGPVAPVAAQSAAAPAARPRSRESSEALRAVASTARSRLASVAADERAVSAIAGACLATVVAFLLGAATGALLLAVVATLGAWWLSGRALAEVGVARTVCEVLVPALVAWLALGGAVPVPAPVAVTGGWSGSAIEWASLNWLAPVVFAAFAIVHHGSTAPLAAPPRARRAEVAFGYALAVTSLVLADRVLGSGAVAVAFALQWPYQAALGHGRATWHWQATRLLAFASMAVACVSAGYGG